MAEGVVLTPPDFSDTNGPLIYLEGPTAGTAEWRVGAAQLIADIDPKLTIASPVVPDPSERPSYEDQLNWQSYYRRIAARSGAVAVWFPCRTGWPPEADYGQAEARELGKLEAEGGRYVLGMEPGFSQERHYRHSYGRDYPSFQIASSLTELCLQAVTLAHSL